MCVDQHLVLMSVLQPREDPIRDDAVKGTGWLSCYGDANDLSIFTAIPFFLSPTALSFLPSFLFFLPFSFILPFY